MAVVSVRFLQFHTVSIHYICKQKLMRTTMVLKYLIPGIFMLPVTVYAQKCTCSQKFEFVKHEIETNYAGFKDKTKDRAGYDKITKEYAEKVKHAKNDAYCMAFISEWLRYFHDHHVGVYEKDDEKGSDTLHTEERSREAEVIHLPEERIKNLKNDDKSVEGIYFNYGDTMYTIAVVKNKNDFRDYVGVILTSKSKYWKPGQVKLELKKRDDSDFSAITYNRYHVASLRRFNFKGIGFDGYSWLKYGKQRPDAKTLFGYDYHRVFTKKLSDSTLYLQIGTFGSDNAPAIDSVVKASEDALKTMPYLVIDVRGNGGGADYAFGPLIPWLYTNPVIGTGNEIYATPDNAKRLRDYTKDPNLPEEDKKEINTLADKVGRLNGKFIVHVPTDTFSLEKVERYPRKIVILTDDWCGSTTEEFLLMARQSRKVTLMGQHTLGVLDYSNVLTAESDCGIELGYSSTRSYRVAKGQGIDNIGIKPKVELQKNSDWIAEAQKYLEGKK